MKNILNTGFIVLASVLFCSAASAMPMITWAVSGPGVSTATQVAGDTWDISYTIDPAGFSTNTWTVSAIAASAGDYEFDWAYSGFHSFFSVTAFLTSLNGDPLYSGGPMNCCIEPSGGFNESGSYIFSGINAGDTLGFTMGGKNLDSFNHLNGTLHLVQVPEPGIWALMGIGILSLVRTSSKNSKKHPPEILG